MKQIFKTTLLAASLAAVCGSAVAGTATITKQTHSAEGLAGVTATQTSNVLTYTLGTGYLSGDKLTLTFSADALKGVTMDPDINVERIDNDDPAVAKPGLTMSLTNKTDSSATYRVTAVEQPFMADGTTSHTTTIPTTGVIVDFDAFSYSVDALSGGSLTVTFSSKDSVGDVIDNTGTLTAVVAEAKSQFTGTYAATGFDNTVDVGVMRKGFVEGVNDTASFTFTPVTTTGWLNLATVTASSATIQGEAGKMADLTKDEFASANGGTVAFTEADATITVSYGSMITNDTYTFTPPTGDDAVVLEAQDFSHSLSYTYTSAGAVAGSVAVASNKDFGEWTLNGATVNIPYMPYGPNSSQIIYVSNAGSQAGDISVEVFDDKGNFYELGVVGVAGAKRVTKIAPLINDVLRAQGFNGSKASITVTVNAPDSDITVYASYNVGGADRGYINTDQYKGK